MRIVVPGLLLAFVLGCGAEPPPKPPNLVPVTGAVTMGGKPLEGAVVIFLPQTQGNVAFSATGATDAKGEYKLQTRSGQELHDGVPTGEYKVIVTRMVKPDGTTLTPDPSTPPAMVGARESVAPKFSNPIQTTLKATVSDSSKKFDFEVDQNPLLGGGTKKS
jgi:hypothetical protein